MNTQIKTTFGWVNNIFTYDHQIFPSETFGMEKFEK